MTALGVLCCFSLFFVLACLLFFPSHLSLACIVHLFGSHKRSLTHHPNSQGWASRCPLLYTFVCLGYGWVGLPYLSFLSVSLKLACYAHVCTCGSCSVLLFNVA